MPAKLVPKEDIPALASHVNTPILFKTLKLLQRCGHIQNSGEIDALTAGALKQLTELDLADAGYAGVTEVEPFIWVSNSNGVRVLQHLEATQGGRNNVAVHGRALTAMSSLSPDEQEAVYTTVEAFRAYQPTAWPSTEVFSLGTDKPTYMLRIAPDLWGFIVVSEAQVIQLFDIVRKDTLEQFLARERAKGKVG